MLTSRIMLLTWWLFLACLSQASHGDETRVMTFIEFTIYNNTYWLSNFKTDLNHARQSCASHQQTLVLFDSRADYSSSSQVLTTELAKRREPPRDIYNVWIDLKSIKYNEGTFGRSWENGDPVLDWDQAEPNDSCLNTSTACCARMVWEPLFTIYYNLRDALCRNQYYFLCRRKSVNLIGNLTQINPEGVNRRQCQSGYQLGVDNKTCENLDECSNSTRPCSEFCTNTLGSYACSCGTGYQLLADGTGCGDIDECNKFSRMCHHTCVNTEGSFKCTCRDGYKLYHPNQTCMDVDECNVREERLCSQVCSNTAGSYKCECHPGYSLNSDNITCRDINECVSSPCQYNCTNTPGSYHCTCPTGHTLSTNGTTCLDIDECQNTSKCPGVCTNTVGSYFCGCDQGYQDTNKRCVDLDECVDGQHNCSQTCYNFDGGYNCSCQQGYTTPADSRFECHDIDECHDYNQTCQHNCINTIGSYYCTCNKGYDLDSNNRSCHDIDECQLNTTICGHFCNNTQGSFYCSCSKGFKLDTNGHSCVGASTNKQCPCSCLSASKLNTTKLSSLQKKVEELKKGLHVNTTTLSALTRSKSSAEDKRESSQTVGSVGIFMVVLVLGLMILPDCVMVLRFLMSL